MNRRTWFSFSSCSTWSFRVGSVMGSHLSQALLRDRGLDRKRVDRAVVEARLTGLLHQLVLLDPREALELGGGDGGVEMVLGAGLVDHLDLGPRKRGLDHQPHLVG